MIVTLLILSLILHLVTFYWLIIMMQRMNQLKASHPESIKREIEDSLSAYLLDMKEENHQLLEHLQPLLNPKQDDGTEEVDSGIDNAEPTTEQIGSMTSHEEETMKQEAKRTQADDELINSFQDQDNRNMTDIDSSSDENNDDAEHSLKDQVIQLHKEGYNETDIAKKLHRGKGEIQLIIKFNQNK